jgi:hypothetical protein
VRTRLKAKELIFALMRKSAERVRNVLEMQGLVFALAAKIAEVNENKWLGEFAPRKECATC